MYTKKREACAEQLFCSENQTFFDVVVGVVVDVVVGNLRIVDDDRKWVTVYYANATSKFRHRGFVDDAIQSRITSSCNPQASAGINPLF